MRPNIPVAAPEQIPELTGLRFFAALSVAVAHAAGIALAVPEGSVLAGVRTWLSTGAGIGMPLFFVLSGFVIHYNYRDVLRDGVRSVARFYWVRFSRLYPIFFLVLVAEVMFSREIGQFLTTGSMPETMWALPYYATLTHSWTYQPFGDRSLVYAFGAALPVSWSISTEWFFYMCFPVLAPVINRLRSAVLVLGAVVLLCVGWSWFMFWLATKGPSLNTWAIGVFGDVAAMGTRDAFTYWLTYFSPYARIGEFVLGCLVAQLIIVLRPVAVDGIERRLAIPITALALGTGAAVWYLSYLYTGSLPGLNILRALRDNFALAPSIGLLVFCVARYRLVLLQLLGRPKMVALGDASYSIYLLHFYIYFLAVGASASPWVGGALQSGFLLTKMAFMVVLVVIVSLGTYRIVEAPSRRWLRKLSFHSLPVGSRLVAALIPVAILAATSGLFLAAFAARAP